MEFSLKLVLVCGVCEVGEMYLWLRLRIVVVLRVCPEEHLSDWVGGWESWRSCRGSCCCCLELRSCLTANVSWELNLCVLGLLPPPSNFSASFLPFSLLLSLFGILPIFFLCFSNLSSSFWASLVFFSAAFSSLFLSFSPSLDPRLPTLLLSPVFFAPSRPVSLFPQFPSLSFS